jgi:predicted site-specific integrase-resolvase
VTEQTAPSQLDTVLDDLITLQVAASLLGVTAQTPREWIRTGKLATGRRSPTGYWRVSRAEIESVIAAKAAERAARKDRRRAARLEGVARAEARKTAAGVEA